MIFCTPSSDSGRLSVTPALKRPGGSRLFGLADHAFDIPVEVTHLVAAPGFALLDADDAGVVGYGAGKRIEVLGNFVGRGGNERPHVGRHRVAEWCNHHHALAKTQ